ncbi:secoisolariciresinol dehydrogenase-like [Punica granatum]|uniref:Secoisolariciresinol dehydrogenase-like n=2 Tax=Punica granatum TaxID=22663 RepID=A0A6P8BUM3_PUNGR|nr:secoisolariciresinol dehydrogenase-like [Punica granatum]
MLCRRAGAAMARTGLRTLFGNNAPVIPRTCGAIDRRFCSRPERTLEGKIALITGAASGIGKATAAKFIANGAKVVIADVNHELGQEAAEELGPDARFTPCDVSKELDVSNAVDFTVSQHGRLDIMFNNAGIACTTPASIVDLDLDRFDRVMAINVRGVVAGIKHASRVMIPNRAGSILCTASVVGILGGMAQLTYSLSKSSVIGIVRSASPELGRHGIRINCISPFAIPTRLVMDEMNHHYTGVGNQRIVDIIHGAGALEGTSCEPIDIANAALYLASDGAKYVSGHNLVVDGGFTVFKSLGFPAPDQVN